MLPGGGGSGAGKGFPGEREERTPLFLRLFSYKLTEENPKREAVNMKTKRIPALRLAVLAFYTAVILLMSVCAFSRAEAAFEAGSGSAEENSGTEAGAPAVVGTEEEHLSRTLTDGDALVGGTYFAEDEDESVMEAFGSTQASVTGAVLEKRSGGASSQNGASFEGLNAAVRVYENAVVTLSDCEIVSDAKNATGVFAWGNGTVYLDRCSVEAAGGGSGGIEVAGGGTLIGKNLTVTSAGKAAIRSDRGGGTMVLDGGTYTSTGINGCPAVYSTADITVRDAECVSEQSRAVIIEGKNRVSLENCVLSGNDRSTKEGSVRANVLLYQSASGDAAEGTSVFSMTGGSMTCRNGAMFYCTNTASEIYLSGAELTLSEDGTLLTVSAGRWGKEGRNGGVCRLHASEQELTGEISVDGISTLELELSDSSFTGAVQGEGFVSVTLSGESSWTLTGDSRVSELGGDLSGLSLNGYTLLVGGMPYEA